MPAQEKPAPRRKKKKFRVHFSQINQQYVDVESFDRPAAMALATFLWRQQNQPMIDEILEENK